MPKIIFIIAVLIASTQVSAATFKVNSAHRPEVTVEISGRINFGDDRQLFEVIRKIERNNQVLTSVNLNSKGGKVSPAVIMGDLLHARNITTRVARDAICTSACFFVWASGRERISHGFLGVHAPYNPDGTPVKNLRQLRGYLIGWGIPERFIEIMMNTPSKTMYFFDSIEIADMTGPVGPFVILDYRIPIPYPKPVELLPRANVSTHFKSALAE